MGLDLPNTRTDALCAGSAVLDRRLSALLRYQGREGGIEMIREAERTKCDPEEHEMEWDSTGTVESGVSIYRCAICGYEEERP